MMRPMRIIFPALLISVAVSVVAQTPPAQTPPPDPDRFEKAHEKILSSQPDKGKEANKLTEAVAAPAPAGASQPVVKKNLIDQHIFGRMERDRIPHAPLSSDEEFVRRVYLDATGALPSPANVRAFLADRDPAKRDKLIDSLIGTDAFANEWAWYWGDLFRTNDTAGTGTSFHLYTKEWLKVDRPYNDVFADIVTAFAKDHSAIPATGFYSASNYNATRALSPTDPDNYYLSNRLDFIDEVSVDVSRFFWASTPIASPATTARAISIRSICIFRRKSAPSSTSRRRFSERCA